MLILNTSTEVQLLMLILNTSMVIISVSKVFKIVVVPNVTE